VYVSGPEVSVSVPLEGVAAKLNIASKTPSEQKPTAITMRGLKKPDSERGFFRIRVPWLDQSLTDSENVIRPDAYEVQKLSALEQNELNDSFAAR